MTLPVNSVILILFATYFCVRIEATEYYFTDFCNSVYSRANKTIRTTTGGVDQRGNIRATHAAGQQYADKIDCTLVLNPPSGYGIKLSVEKINLRQETFTCVDTISIQWSTSIYSYPWYTDLTDTCSLIFSREFSHEGPMRINFKTGFSGVSTFGRDFRIAYTTYNPRNVGAIAGGVVGGIVFLAIVVVIVFLCRRRRTVVTSTTTICASPAPMGFPQQQNYASQQPPPYTTSYQHQH